MSEWVKIGKGDKRPTGLVLVSSCGLSPEDEVARAIFGEDPPPMWEIQIARWHRGAWRGWHRPGIIHDVTHWMPLPEPPEDEE